MYRSSIHKLQDRRRSALKAAVLGSGLMGGVVALDLARSEGVDSVVVSDVDEERLAAVLAEIEETR
jgi:threonine dehydrogenase-like Zn-dependent dehydrogenase